MTTTSRILVVDDEPDMARGLRRILRINGYDVQIAHSGEEAIDRSREWPPDGILMDIKMPGIDGVEAYRQIRVMCPNAFVVFMTAFSSLVDEAREEGAVDVLTKPLDPAETCELLANALSTRPVLIVDDDTDFCESLSRILKAKGCTVETADSPAQALAAFKKQPRSVVLLDMRLGDTNGLELLQMFKQTNRTALILQMSGYSEMSESMRQGMELSATACFNKPLDIDSVLDTIARSMRHPK
ncbi:MAG: two-component system response regulator HydG [Pirellulaceae bacterium]|jgi:two-component system response regulator HydG